MFVPALFCFAFALLMIVVWIVFSMVGGQNDDARLSFSKKFKNHTTFGELALISVVIGILLLLV